MIIDCHTHIFPREFREGRERLFPGEPSFKAVYKTPGSKLAGVSELLGDMDEQGVDKSLVFGFPWHQEDLFRRHNDYILEAVQRHPRRLIGLCCFSPLASGGAREAERCLQSGLSGVGELAVYRSGLTARVSEAMGSVMAVCMERDVPLMLHTNEPVGHRYPGKSPMTLSQIYAFLRSYPSNRILLAHWGGGLLFYALMKKEVRKVMENAWFDTAASPFLYRPDIYMLAGGIIGFDRIVFGSDYPLLKPRRYLEEMENAGLPASAMEKVTCRNAQSLFRIPP